MFEINCNKYFSFELNVLSFGDRLNVLLNDNGKKKILYFKNEFDNSTFRYRCYNFEEALRKSDKYEITYFTLDEAESIKKYLKNASLIVFQRTMWTYEVDNIIFLAHKIGIPVYFDMDDLIFTKEHAKDYFYHIGVEVAKPEFLTYFAISGAYLSVMEQCDGFISTTPFLAKKIEEYFNKPCFIVNNSLNKEQITESEYIKNNRKFNEERFKIGYFSGSFSHKRDFETISDCLLRLLSKYDNIDIVIAGYMKLCDHFDKFIMQNRVLIRPFVSFKELQYEIGKVDVNVVPLQIDEFNEAKSELKFFEAGAVCVPSCVADTEVYRNIIKDGENGFICKDNEWFEKIERLYLDKKFRDDMAKKAEETSLSVYSPDAVKIKLEKMFDAVFEK